MPRTLDPIFRPHSIALIGASRNRGTIGWTLLDNMFRFGFTGKIFPVNPSVSVLHSVKCYPSVAAIPDPVDCAIISVPRDMVMPAILECAQKGVKGLVIITAGFREVSVEGRTLEQEILTTVRSHGMRMIGPNCMGIINAEESTLLDGTFAPTPATFGPIGFATQSGALGVAILNVARSRNLGFTQFVSMGNKADVSSNDMIEYWEHDPATRIIALYLESFGNPRKFTEMARRISREKPIIIVKSGRTAAGAKAASSHTGALAGSDVAIDALLEQCGVTRCTTIEEMFDLAAGLSTQPVPKGNRVAIVTNAGGPGIMATDACIEYGLTMAEYSDETRATLRAFLPSSASVGNPVDMIASATDEHYAKAVRAVLADPGVDAAIVINVTPILYNPIDVSRAIVDAIRGADKPVLSVYMAVEEFYTQVRDVENHPPIYRFPEPAARVLADMVRIGQWRTRPPGTYRKYTFDDVTINRVIQAGAGRYLMPLEVAAMLKAAGLPTAELKLATDEKQVVDAANAIGYPVVLKAVGEAIVHKSDIGGVAIGIENEKELRAAFTTMQKKLAAAKTHADAFLVQRMVEKGKEVIIGAVQDPKFGPLVMFGLGGTYVEVLGDVRFRVAPVSVKEAGEMLSTLRGAKILDGVRGERPSDKTLLVDMILRMSHLASEYPEIAEIEVNPFVVHEHGGVAVDARIRVK